MKAEDSGTAIFDLLSRHPGGLTRKRACEVGGLTFGQWTRGRAWLRDLFGQEPVIWNRIGGDQVYTLATQGTERDSREYWERILRTQITRAKREYNDAHGIAEAYPTIENQWQEEMARRRLTDLTFARQKFLQLELAEVAA